MPPRPGTSRDMDTDAPNPQIDLADLLNRMNQQANTIAQLQQQLNNVQAPPPVQNTVISTAQFQQLLNQLPQAPAQPAQPAQGQAGAGAGQAQAAAAPNNTITGIPFEDNPPLQGVEDAKRPPEPIPFNGTREDARPFLDRMEAYFSLVPHITRLTRTRIVYTCTFVQSEPAIHWAQQTSKDVRNMTAGDYYTDHWDTFKTRFLQNFGIVNEAEHATNRLDAFTQGNASFKSWILEFKRLQKLAGIPDQYVTLTFKKNIRRVFFNKMMSHEPVPTTLPDMIRVCTDIENAWDQQEQFRRTIRREPNDYRYQPAYYTRRQELPQGEPMDIDALLHEKDEEINEFRQSSMRRKGKDKESKKSKKNGGKKKKDVSRASSKKSKTPIPSTSNTRPSTSKIRNDTNNMANLACHRCGQKGHFIRDCTTDPSKIRQRHPIRALADALPVQEESESSEDEEEEDSSSSESENEDAKATDEPQKDFH